MANEAVTESAKKAIALAEKAGKFLNNITGGDLKELGEGFHDWASYFRMKNLIRIQDRVEEIRKTRAKKGKATPIPPRLAIPLINEASLEDAKEVQELWAQLIAKAMDDDSSVKVHPAFIEVIKQLSPDEALILTTFPKFKQYPVLFSYYHQSSSNHYFGASQRIPYDELKSSLLEHFSELELIGENLNSYIDNLRRLQIIEFDYEDSLQLNDNPFNHYRDEYVRMHEQIELEQKRTEHLLVTDFGQRFIESCVAS